jgi:hypothetical protein
MNNEPFEKRSKNIQNPQIETIKISQIENEKTEKTLAQLHERKYMVAP